MLDLLEKIEEPRSFYLKSDVQPDVICYTETWLPGTDEISNYLITEYISFLARNMNSKGDESCCNVTNFAILQRKLRSVFRKLFVYISAKTSKRLKLVVYNPPR